MRRITVLAHDFGVHYQGRGAGRRHLSFLDPQRPLVLSPDVERRTIRSTTRFLDKAQQTRYHAAVREPMGLGASRSGPSKPLFREGPE